MAAPMKYVRVLLTVKKLNHESTTTTPIQPMWYSINFEKATTIMTVVSDLCRRFGGDLQYSSLQMERALIPQWEICSQILRDNDKLEFLSQTYGDGSHSEHLESDICNLERSRKKRCYDESETVANHSPILKHKKKKHKREEEPDYTVNEGYLDGDSHNDLEEKLDTQTPKSSRKKKKKRDKEPEPESSESSNEQTSKLNASPTTDNGHECVAETTMSQGGDVQSPIDETSAVTNQHDDSDTESLVDDISLLSASKKKDRSALLTPAEIELIAELDGLPKPKRKRKHKRKKSVLADESATKKVEKVEHPENVNMKSDYQGVKKVFDSDAEDVQSSSDRHSVRDSNRELSASKTWDAVTAHNSLNTKHTNNRQKSSQKHDAMQVQPRSELTANQQVEVQQSDHQNDECFSSIDVKPKIDNGVHMAVATQPSIPIYSSLSGNMISKSPNTANLKPKSRAGTKSPKGAASAGPVVYKREKKLKLRATISPAIIEELQNSTPEEAVSQFIENSQSEELAAVATLPQSSTPLNGHFNSSLNDSKKKIKWHKQSQPSSSIPLYTLSKENQLNDDQHNISTIHKCESPSLSYSKPDSTERGDDDEIISIVQPAKDYSKYKKLEGPPREGDKLAFKRLEVSDDYTPIVSEYREGLVMGYEPKSKMMHIKLLNKPPAVPERKKKGIFDVYIEEDGETLTNVDDARDQIVDVLSSLIDPRLISD